MKISVFGGGAWGTTLAQYLYKNSHEVSLWEFDETHLNYLKKYRYPMFFPHVKLSKKIFLIDNIRETVKNAEILLLTVPSQAIRSTLKEICRYSNKNQIFVIASKGIEIKTGELLSSIVMKELKTKNVVVLSGPSFAIEVAKGFPTAIVAAGEKKVSKIVQECFSSANLRIYTNTDIIGVGAGGSLKNIIAIACGIAKGMGLGDNSLAAIVTRGLVEITSIGIKLGAKRETFSGLSGLGDLVMTSFSQNSRNESFGELIGKGLKTNAAIKKIGMTVEGVYTTKAVMRLAKKFNIEMPITNEVYNIIFKHKDPKKAITTLMTRDKKPE